MSFRVNISHKGHPELNCKLFFDSQPNIVAIEEAYRNQVKLPSEYAFELRQIVYGTRVDKFTSYWNAVSLMSDEHKLSLLKDEVEQEDADREREEFGPLLDDEMLLEQVLADNNSKTQDPVAPLDFKPVDSTKETLSHLNATAEFLVVKPTPDNEADKVWFGKPRGVFDNELRVHFTAWKVSAGKFFNMWPMMMVPLKRVIGTISRLPKTKEELRAFVEFVSSR